MKKLISLLVALTMLFALYLPADAADYSGDNASLGADYEGPMLRYSHIKSFQVSGSLSGSTIRGTATGSVYSTAASVSVTVTAERSSDGRTYSSWKSIGSNSGTTSASVNATTSGATSTYDYRIKAVITAKSASGSTLESDTLYYYI